MKRKASISTNSLQDIDVDSVSWRSIHEEGLDLDYALAIPRPVATTLLEQLEDTLEYFTGNLAKIKVFGKEYPLPRQQVAYGDPGITYTYSSVTVPALPWPAPVLAIRDFLERLKGIKFDFVLVNKYRNGNDHMGEHRDNEPELDHNYPIASISLGQERTFVLKHKDAKKPGKDKRNIPPDVHLLSWQQTYSLAERLFGHAPGACARGDVKYYATRSRHGDDDLVKIELEHGSVLFMNPPTNEFWYHSLPVRKRLLGARINLTFRKMRLK